MKKDIKPADTPSGYSLLFLRIVRSEWIKLTTLRSTWWIALVTILTNVGISLIYIMSLRYGVLHQESGSDIPPGGSEEVFQPGQLGMLSSTVAQGCHLLGPVIFCILAIITITNEYSTGSIDATFIVGPRRGRILLAKLVVIGLAGIIVLVISLAIGWASGYLFLQDSVGVDLSLTSPDSLRILGGFIGETVILAWLCFGLGALIRSTAGAISAAIGVMWILPLIFSLLSEVFIFDSHPTGWRLWFVNARQYLPTTAGSQVSKLSPDTSLYSPWVGLGILGIWALVSLIFGFTAAIRRDAE